MTAQDLAVGRAGLSIDEGARGRVARLRDTWLVGRREVVQLLVCYLTFVTVWTAVGFLVTHAFTESWLVHADEAAERWFVRQRTPTLDATSYVLSMLADTVVKVVATTAVALTLLYRFRRWKEPLMIIGALVLEAAAFITITWIVDRPRPDVPRIDSSPVGSSFPSGHVAACVAYAAIVVVLFEHTRKRLPRILAVVAVALLTVAVALSRMYRGMHHPIDVVMGALLGGASVVAAVLVMREADRRRTQHAPMPSLPTASRPSPRPAPVHVASGLPKEELPPS